MHTRKLLRTLALSGVVALTGCATAPRDKGFDVVQKTVLDRIGQRVQWDQGTAEDHQVHQTVDKLLASELSADTAVQIALLCNENLQATYEDLGIAQAELVDAGLLRNPTLEAEVRFPRYAAIPFEFNVTQSLIDLFTTPLRRRAAGAAFEAARQRVTTEILNTAADTKAAFYRAQGAGQLVIVRRTTVSATEASYDAARRLHEAGNINDLALADEQALHEESKIELARAQRDAVDAREELSAMMGVSGRHATWTLAPKLPDLPAEEPPLPGLELLAISQRNDLAAAREDVEATRGSLALIRSTALGDVSIGGHLTKEPDDTLTAGPTLSIPLPIFNQGQAAIAAAQARLRQSEHRLSALAVQVRSQVRRASNRMSAARDMAETFRRVIVPLRHQIVEENMLQFNAMRIGMFELLQTKQAEIDAGRDYVESLRDYWVARAALERAVGGRLPTGASIPTTQAAVPPSHGATP